MKEEFKQLLADRVNRYALVIALCVVSSVTVFFTFRFTSLPPKLPLFYNRPWGETQLGDASHMFLILSASLLVLVFNCTLALLLYKNNPLLARILMWVSALVTVLTATTVVRVILLVT